MPAPSNRAWDAEPPAGKDQKTTGSFADVLFPDDKMLRLRQSSLAPSPGGQTFPKEVAWKVVFQGTTG